MSISVDLRLDFQLSDRTCTKRRVLQLGHRQGRGLLLRGTYYPEKIMQRPKQPMGKRKNKYSVLNVCPQCQTVVTSTLKDLNALQVNMLLFRR